ncbi:phage tail tape measure protein [Candidatus Weimeria sp. HCP3S3_B5]|uniref:phage tail tape measure protein n=1 Tax=Candidatus Weimeria sp. HCP3S3_B5 TaxID=3438871 RepID=UPI003F8CBE09
MSRCHTEHLHSSVVYSNACLTSIHCHYIRRIYSAKSAKECAEALNYLALAGYDTQQMFDTLPTVLNLATAGDIDLASASDMVTDAMLALDILANSGIEGAISE